MSEGEKSPLQLRFSGRETSQKLTSGRTDHGCGRWSAQKVCLWLVVAAFIAAAGFFLYLPHATGKQEEKVGLQPALMASENYTTKTLAKSQQKVGHLGSDSDKVRKFLAKLGELQQSSRTAGSKNAMGDSNGWGTKEGKPASDEVADLFEALSESDTTASTTGDEITEQKHHSLRSEAESEDVEEAAELGFESVVGSQPKKGAKSQNIAKGSPDSSTTAAAKFSLPVEIGRQHLRIFLADISPKYNMDLLEATLGLEEFSYLESFSLEDIVKDPLSIFEEAGLLGIPSYYLDIVFHSLLLQSPLRVFDMFDADIIWVPFWVHKLVRLDQEIEKPNKYDLAQSNFWREAGGILPLLGKKPHILVVPGQEADLRSSCGGFGIDFLCHPRASELTILSPEIYATKVNSSKKGGGAAHEGMSIPVPDVANIRLEGPDALPSKFDARKCHSTKQKLISEAFRSRKPARKALKTQCLGNPKECSHAEPSSRLSNIAFTKAVFENDKAAWFSLHPPGDTTVRLPFFNSLLAGALPVVFDPSLPKLLPFADHINWQGMLVQINLENLTAHNLLVAEALKAEFTVEERLARLEAIHGLRHLLHYSSKTSPSVVTFDALGKFSEEDDAFTMALKALVQGLCNNNQLVAGRCPHR